MPTKTFKHHLAIFLRQTPWLMAGVYRIWRLFQRKYSVGVVGVLLDRNQNILLVEHVFHPRHPWGLPGGWVDHGEDPARALQREFAEELQVEVQIGPILLAEFHNRHHLDIAYLCLTNSEIGEVSYELLQFAWYEYQALPDLHVFHRRAIQQAMILNKERRESHDNNTER